MENQTNVKKVSKKWLAVDIAEIGLFVALMAVFTRFVTIPFEPVPLTFQTVLAVLSGLLLGWRKGMIAMGVYVLMGLIGVPVFGSAPYGTIFYVVKPAFGYLLGFILAAGVAGLPCLHRKWWGYILAAVLAFLVDYAIGMTYFVAVWLINGYEGLGTAFITYNVLYMPKDIVLCLLAGVLAWRVEPLINRRRKA